MRRYYGIELLRLLTSLSVLLYHYRHFFSPHTTFSSNVFDESKTGLPFYSILEIFYNRGFYGVHMFYAISGFVFAHVYLSYNEKISGKEFFINRFARLYPLHFATLILVAVLQIINLSFSNTFQIVPINDFYHFTLNLFFISAWGFEQGHSFNAPIWSVSVEIFIYGIFFLLLNILRKYKISLALIICIILLFVAKLQIIDSIFHPDMTTDNLFLECGRLFFSGVLVYYLSLRIKSKYILFFASVIMLILSLVGNFKTYLFCPSLLLLVVSLEDLVKGERLKKFFVTSGNLTYALYLLHIPIQIIILLTIKNLNISDLIYLETYFFIIFFTIMIISAHLCFKFYEKPMNLRIRKIFIKKK